VACVKHETIVLILGHQKKSMSAIILNDSRVHYEALGRGKPVVFLHGWVGSWRYWIPAMQAASNSFRAYAVDLYGFGETSRESLGYTLERQAELVQDFLAQLGIGRVAIIAHGLGALVSFVFTLRRKDCVDRILAVNCPLDYSAVNRRVHKANTLELTGWLSSRSPGSADFLVDAPKADQKAVHTSMIGLQSNNLFNEVKAAGIPILLLYGAKDPAIQTPNLAVDANQTVQMHQIIMDGSGHFPMIDEPAQFNRLMASFLALPSGSSPRQLSLKEEWKRRVR
jgi:pimeloyl-ACP methyl ester carboxylesterase